MKSDRQAFLYVAQHWVKKDNSWDLKTLLNVYCNEVKEAIAKHKYSILLPVQSDLSHNFSTNSHHKHDRTMQHINMMWQLVKVDAYSKGLRVKSHKRRCTGVCVYHMARRIFLEFKNLQLLSWSLLYFLCFTWTEDAINTFVSEESYCTQQENVQMNACVLCNGFLSCFAVEWRVIRVSFRIQPTVSPQNLDPVSQSVSESVHQSVSNHKSVWG
jgi:hypothetical protein